MGLSPTPRPNVSPRRYTRGCGPIKSFVPASWERAKEANRPYTQKWASSTYCSSPDAPFRWLCKPRRTPSPATPNYMGDVLWKCFAQNEPYATPQKKIPPSPARRVSREGSRGIPFIVGSVITLQMRWAADAGDQVTHFWLLMSKHSSKGRRFQSTCLGSGGSQDCHDGLFPNTFGSGVILSGSSMSSSNELSEMPVSTKIR